MVTGKWGIPCTGILCYLQSRSQSLQLRPLEFNKKKKHISLEKKCIVSVLISVTLKK